MSAVAPPMRMSGLCANCAFFTAVIVFVRPGPAVTAAGVLDRRDGAFLHNFGTTVPLAENKVSETIADLPTPGMPVRRATPSAAKTVVTSWRTSITRTPITSQPTKMGAMWPPTRVKIQLRVKTWLRTGLREL